MSNVYIITTESFPNGLAATQRIRCYAKSIVELGYECQVLCVNRCEDPNKPLGNIDTKGIADGCSFRYMGSSTILPPNYIEKQGYKIFDALRLILIIVYEFTNNDKVIFYSYSSLLYKVVTWFSKLKGYKVYYELNEFPTHQMNGFHMEDNDSPKELKHLYKLLCSNAGVLCISKALQNLLLKCGIPKEKTHIVNMLVNTARFEGVIKTGSEKYIGYCGNASNNKDGVDQLIKSFALVHSDYPDIKLYIMGPKQSECQNELLAAQLGIADKVVFTGMISPDDLPQMLMNATVLTLDRPANTQSKYGFPTKLGEYLSTGNPVVITRVGDIPLFLEDGISAYLAEPDNVSSFAGKMIEALRNQERAEDVGKRGKMVAEKNFSDQKVKQQLKEALSL